MMDYFISGTVVASILVVAVSLVVIAFTFNGVFENQLRHECIVWQGYAETFPGFYLADWQQAQCDDMGVVINVKKS